ncbi:ATP-dependent RNA helicase DDX55-like [Montipora capricornis]|uniref:ATP-dependent RNA helicase DDX55-like n=1 Tax=Montipora capricornis TaxID=246305 RepID=UPI0035F1D340
MATSWSELKPSLSDSVLKIIGKFGFHTMTPVQTATIPLFMSHKDVAVEAVTGSGKTLAFLIPIVEILLKREEKLKKHDVGAIIISPTRELAKQIDEVLQTFTEDLSHLRQLLLIGGVDPLEDIQKFKSDGGHILIGTPGRLEDFFSRKKGGLDLAAHVRSMEVLVLDEADRLLDMGFEASINTILGFLPKQRRTGLFSATQTDEVKALIRAGLRNPVRVTVREKFSKAKSEQRTPSTLKNFYTICEGDKKFSTLVAFLKARKTSKNMVFFSTCACVNYFSKALERLLTNVTVLSIHGKMRSKRHKVFDSFRRLTSGVLVCTDVMARGVDIPEVDWVIQFDPPSSANAFVHRCGRTARIGNQGNALLFLLPAEESYVDFISINQKVPLQPFEIEETATDIVPNLRKMAKKDRDIYDKGMRAFVSFVQFYRKHECGLIFRTADLNLGKLATGFGLLKLPVMPELKEKIVDFQPVDIDVEKINYKDKNREKERKRKLQEQQDSFGDISQKTSDQQRKKKMKRGFIASSKNKERKDKKEKLEAQRRFPKKKRQQYYFDQSELEDLAREANLVKKLKAGKISKEEFESRIGNEDEEDE